MAHGLAVNWILVGGDELVHIDSDGGQCAVQILQGLLRHGGLSAHDPGELHVQHAEVSAAVHQGVVVVVGGQHPVRSWGGVCRFEGTRHSAKLPAQRCPQLDSDTQCQDLTLKESDQQLGRLKGVLGHGRATDGVDGAVSAAQADIRYTRIRNGDVVNKHTSGCQSSQQLPVENADDSGALQAVGGSAALSLLEGVWQFLNVVPGAEILQKRQNI